MRFGQKWRVHGGERYRSRWIPYETWDEAVGDGCAFVNVLEIDCSLLEYASWCTARLCEGQNPGSCRLSFPFKGPFYADFDEKNGQDGLAGELFTACERLLPDLRPEWIRLWYTGGKGFHMTLDPVLFGMEDEAHPKLPSIYREMGIMLGLGSILDPTVYSESRGRLWRVPGVIRKNGKRKVPITLDQLTWPRRALDELARSDQIRSLESAPPRFSPRLAETFRAAREKVSSQRISKRRGVSRRKVPQDLAGLVAALPRKCVDEYGDWLKVGMALHHETHGGSQGLRLWHRWSAASHKYEADVLDRKWKGFGRVGVTRGTLIHMVHGG